MVLRQKTSKQTLAKQTPQPLSDSCWDLTRQPDTLHAILDTNPNLVSVKDWQGRYCYGNQSFMQFFGFTGQQILGKTDADLFDCEMAASNRLEDSQVLESDAGVISVEQILTDHQGSSSWHSTIRKRVCLGEEKAVHIVAISTNISGLKNLEDRVIHERLHDPLTGLPNLVSLKIALSEPSALMRQGDAFYALAIFDVSQVKRINETLGFGIGDQLITAVARRLRRCVHLSNMIAHLKADTFAVVIKHLSNRAEVCPLVEKIFDSLRSTFIINEHEINLSVNMGIAFGGQETFHTEDLLRDAQIAHHLAKASKKSQYVVFEEYMRLLHNNHVELENDLRKASGQGQLVLHYQPIVSTDTGQVASIEALLRWQHPKRGLIYPDEFIGLAEESELIVGMGEWVLREACGQTRRWQILFPNQPHLHVSVNISGKQLMAEGFMDKVISILDETGLDAHHLKMEITESIYLGKSGQVLQVLNQLTQLGVKLYIDDFGTGYSSLSYLNQIPFDAIKIDRSFIDGVVIRDGDTRIVEAIVRLASDLGKELVAEGVETLAQREWLRHMGCQYEQGFLFSRPLDVQQVEQFFQVNV